MTTIRRQIWNNCALGFALIAQLYSFSVSAQSNPASLNLSGGLFYPNGTAILDSSVNFKIDIYDASATCLLYTEEHLGQNLSQTKGGFSLALGSGTSQNNFLENSTNFDRALFANSGQVAAFNGCPSGVDLSAGSTRVIRVSYDIGQGFVAMTPDVPITNTPYAMIADSLQGLPASSFVQTDGVSLTQTNVANIFSNINYPKLEALLSGTSNQYIPASPAASVGFNGQLLTNIANPTAAQDAATKNYADSDLGGLPITIAGIGPGIGNGKTLVWDQVADAWVAQTAGTVTYVGSGTGLIGGNFTTQGTLAVDVGTSANKILQLNSKAQIPALDGSLLFNVNASRLGLQSVSNVTPSLGQILGWNALSAQWEPQINAGITALTGDVHASGPGLATATLQPNSVNLASKINNSGNGPNQLLITDSTTGTTIGYATCSLVGQVYQWTAQGWQCVSVTALLGNSSVAAGTYGSANQIPQLSVDASGRVVSVTNVNVAYPVISVNGKTGVVTLNGADLGLGTASTQNYGTAAGDLVQLDSNGLIPSTELPTGTGTITGVLAGQALLGGGSSGLVTLSVDVGVTANKVVQLNAQAQYPSVDGALITNVNATRVGTRTISTAQPNAGQFIGWNMLAGEWEPMFGNSGSVTLVQTSTGLIGGPIVSGGTLSVDVGTSGGKIVQFSAAAQYPQNDGFLISNVSAQKLQTLNVSTKLPNAGQVLAWNNANQDWEATSETTGTVTSVATGTGLYGGPIVSTGTLNVDVGTAANKVLQVTSSGIYPADDGSLISNVNANRIGTRAVSTNGPAASQVLAWNATNGDWEPTSETTGTVTNISSGTGLTGGPIASTGTLNVDVGTAANKVLQVTASGIYPADDGSLISNLNANRIGTRAVSTNGPGAGQVLAWNVTNGDWEPTSETTGTVTNISSGTGLTGGPIASTGTLNVDVGTAANKILQVTAAGIYPADDGSLISNLNANRIGTRAVSTNGPATNQVLAWNATNGDWEPTSETTGTVTNISSGTGLTGGPIANSGTLNVDVGTAANKVLQVTASGIYPADDGSLISNLNANRIGTRSISTNGPGAGQVLAWNVTNGDWEPTSETTGTVTNISSGTGLNGGPISSTGTLNVDVGTAANKVLQVTASGIYPADDGSLISNVNANRIGTRSVSTNGPGAGQVLGWNSTNNDWEPISASTGTVTNISSGTGLTGGPIASSGTLNVDVGTAANKILQVTSAGTYPADDGSLISNVNANRIGTRAVSTNGPGTNQVLAWNTTNGDWEPTSETTGTVTNISSGTGLTGGPIANTGTLNVDVGTAANKILQITAAGIYPADDGSLISNLNASRIGTRNISTNSPVAGQVLTWNVTNSDWEPISASTGTVTNISSGTGLTGGPIANTGTLNVDVGTAANKILQVTSTGTYPADDGSLISNVNANRIGTRSVSTNGPGAGQVLGWNTTNNDWEPISASTGTVTNISSGTGLTGGSIANTGTLNVDVGTAANKILQVTPAGTYPADDGSLISNVNANRIGTRAVSTNGPGASQVLSWNTTNSDWEPASASTGTVTNISSGTGLTGGPIANAGTLNVDVGTAANKILQITAAGIYPADDGSLISNVNANRIGTRPVSTNGPGTGQVLGWNATNNDWEPISTSTGTVTNISSGTGLTGGPIANSGTLNVDVGTAANKVLQVTSSGIYPADDGSLISNLNANRIGTRAVSTSGPGAGQVLGWNSTNSDWEPTLASTGTVTNISSGTGLTGGPIANTGTLNVDVGTAANKILQVTQAGTYPADDGSLISNVNANRIGSRAVSTNGPNAGQVLGWNSTNSDWEPISTSTGTVTNISSGTGLTGGPIANTGTLNVDVGTAANKVLQVTSSGIYPADDGSLISNLNANRIGTRSVSTNGPNPGQVLGWNSTNNDWEPISTSTGTVTNISSGTGLLGGPIANTGTLNVDVGTAANKILQVTASGTYPADDGSLISNLNATRIGTRAISSNAPNAGQVLGWNTTNNDWEPLSASTGTVTNIFSGTGLTGGPIANSGTLNVDVGTAANKVLQVTSSGIYPADDGSLISNINATRIGSRNVSTNGPNAGQVLGWNSTNSDWEPVSTSTGTVTNISSGTGLTGGPIANSGTLNVDVGTTANKILQVTASGIHPAIDGSLMSNLNATRIGTRVVSTNGPGPGQVLGWNSTNSDWEPISSSSGNVQSVVSGTGLIANTITLNGTITVDVGTAANKVLQVTSSGIYPADDGSLISNVNANRIGTRAVSTSGPGAGQVLGWNSTNSDWEPVSTSTGTVTNIASGTGLIGGPIANTGTLNVDVGTAANKVLQVTAAGTYPADDGSLISNVNANRIGTRAVSTNGPAAGQVLGWNSTNSDWEPISTSTGTVTNISSGTGLTGGPIANSGTLNVDVGTAANKILQVTSSGIYPADDGSLISNVNANRIGTRVISTNGPNAGQVLGWNSTNSDWEPVSTSTGTVTNISSGTGLIGGPISNTGTLNVDVGTAANKILQVTATGIHPAIDGSLMSNLNATRIGTRLVSTNGPGPGQVLGWNSTNSDWEPISSSSGNVQSVVSGTGLIANTITLNGTITVDVGTAANKILQVNAAGTYPADDGSLISNVNANRIGTRAVSTNGPNAGQVLGWNSTNSDWEPISTSTGTVTNISSGTGLTGGPIANTGTLNVDVGTAANKVLQVTSAGTYPADDGSLISNVNANRIGTRAISTNGPSAGQVLGWNTTNNDWEPTSASTGTVTNISSGTGLTGGPIANSGTLNVDVGTAANKILQVTATGIHPAIDGSLMSNLNATRIGTRVVSTNGPGPGQVLGWNSTNSDWEPTSGATGTVTNISSGTGLTGGPIAMTGTFNVDVGTAANKILQVTQAGTYPADDGALISNLNASRIGTFAISTIAPTAGQALIWNTTTANWTPSNIVAGSTGFVNGGNSFGGPATLGTTDNYSLTLKTNNIAALTILNSGLVGIGTTSPGTTLDVNGAFQVEGAGSAAAPYATLNGLRISGGDTANSIYNAGRNIAITADSGHFVSLSQTSNASVGLSVNTANGNVGIGSANPSAPLDIKGVNAPPANSGTTTTAILRIENSTGNGNVLDQGNYNTAPYGSWLQAADRSGLNTNYPIVLNPNGGNVGIGTSNPIDAFEVHKAANENFAVRDPNVALGTTGLTGIALQSLNDANTVNEFLGLAGTTIALMGGNVGVGTTTPLSTLDVNGTERVTQICDHSGANCTTPATLANAVAASPTLATVTANGATTTTASTFNGGLTASALTVNGAASTTGAMTVGGFLTENFNTNTIPASGSGLSVGWNRSQGNAEVNFYNVYNSPGTAYTFSTKTGASTYSDLMTISGSGNVGIGTTNPGKPLDVRGEILSEQGAGALDILPTATGAIFYTNNSYSASAPTTNFTQTMALSNGNVGIGTTTPNITGLGTALTLNNQSLGSAIEFKGHVSNSGAGKIGGIYGYGDSYGLASIVLSPDADPQYGRIDFGVDSGFSSPSQVMAITSDGVQIGPNVLNHALLDVEGSGGIILDGGNVGIGTTSPSFALDVFAATAGGGIAVRGSGVPAYHLFNSATEQATLGASTAPGTYSSVASTGDAVLRALTGNLILTADNAAGNIYLTTGATDTAKLSILNGGNVGVGSATPTKQLSVYSTTPGAAVENISDYSASATAAPELQFGIANSNGFATPVATRIWSLAADISHASLNFSAYNAAAPTTAQMTLVNGNLGIGTTSPGSVLDVNGTERVTQICDRSGANCVTPASLSAATGTSTLATVTANGATTTTASTFSGGLSAAGITDSGSLTFSQANPTISASSYTVMPGGLFVSGGTLYSGAPIQARAGVGNDSAAYLQVNGGTSGYTYFPNNTGMGTTGPGAKLEIQNTANQPALSVGDSAIDDGATYGMLNLTRAADTTRAHLAFIRAGSYVWQTGYVQNTNTLGFFPWNFSGTQGTPTLALAGGAVGIGIAAPDQMLTVAGTIHSTSGGIEFPDGSVQSSAVNNATVSGKLDNTAYQAASISYGGDGGPMMYSTTSSGVSNGAAMMSFHRPGAFAVNFGLDTDNQLKVGGWSMGNNAYVLYHSGNFTPSNYVAKAGDTMSGNLTANGGFQVGNGVSTGLYGDGTNMAVRGYSGGDIYFQSAAGAQTNMIVKNNGNVGIGLANPAGQLDITHNPGNGLYDGIVIGQQDGDNTETIQTYIDNGGGGGYGNWNYAGGCCKTLFIQPHGGQVGIGVLTTDQLLTVGGTIHSTSGGFEFPDGSVQTTAASNSSVNYASTAGVANKVVSVGAGNATFNWSGQPGQPSWLWGSNDGVNFYVWNPAGFNVNYATTSGTASALSSTGDNVSTTGWFRSNGSVGWYNNTFNGGIWMEDSTWIRTYGNKNFYVQGGSMAVDGSLGVGTTNPDQKLTVVGIVHSTSGGFEFPDGTVQSTAAAAQYYCSGPPPADGYGHSCSCSYYSGCQWSPTPSGGGGDGGD